MTRVLITGGTGLIGSYLSKRLLGKGYEVIFLSRTKKSGTSIPTYTWDYTNSRIEKEAVSTADYIIHLAGTNIGEKRWTVKRKQQILESRVKTGELIFNSVVEQNIKLKAFITASAVGYYGSVTSDKIFTEEDTNYGDFVGNICKSWEQVADKFQSTGIRTVKLRTGIVLTKKGGALEKLILPFKFGVGAIIGKGKHYLPWIHIDDLCAIYIKAIEDIEMNGVYNTVAPDHLSFKTFIKQMSILYQKRFLNIKIPAFILKLIFGKMSEILLNGSRISSNKLVKAGYKYKFPTIQIALKDLLLKNTKV